MQPLPSTPTVPMNQQVSLILCSPDSQLHLMWANSPWRGWGRARPRPHIHDHLLWWHYASAHVLGLTTNRWSLSLIFLAVSLQGNITQSFSFSHSFRLPVVPVPLSSTLCHPCRQLPAWQMPWHAVISVRVVGGTVRGVQFCFGERIVSVLCPAGCS